MQLLPKLTLAQRLLAFSFIAGHDIANLAKLVSNL